MTILKQTMKPKIKYEVFYNGKPTGIITKEKSISLDKLKKVIPNASPVGNIDFKIKTQP